MKSFKDRTFTCVDCGIQPPRTAPNQKRCKDCLPAYQLKHTREWHARNVEKERAVRRERYAANPEKFAARRKAAQAANPEAYRRYHREWAQRNREKLAMQRRARQYGLTVELLTSLLEEQNHICPVCDEPLTDQFHVDHCHASGYVRGLLHRACNTGIGMLSDNPERCERAATYLRRPIDPDRPKVREDQRLGGRRA